MKTEISAIIVYSIYYVTPGKNTISYGHLTFAGHDLDKSQILEDIKVFYLEFKGEPDKSYYREEWADPLRAEVLKRLTSDDRCWYMSMIDIEDKKPGEETEKTLGKRIPEVDVQSEKPFGYGYGFITRTFLEVPNDHFLEIVEYFWSKAAPAFPIEGYCMEAGQIGRIKEWDARPRDDQVFREVCDRTFINFYTLPAEHVYFVFVTNKLTYEELVNIINLADLQARAKEIGREIDNKNREK